MDKTYLFFDTETTGVSKTKDRIVSLSCFKTKDFLEITDRRNILINPTIPIPKEASDVHGITDEMVKGRPPFASFAKHIHAYFSDCVLCGYNSDSFDVVILSEEFNRCGYKFPQDGFETMDGFTLFRKREERTLTAALKFYCGKIMEGAHDAQNDINATFEVMKAQMERYGLSAEQFIEECKVETLDLDGKIAMKDGAAVYNFGKCKGQPVRSDVGFAQWMLNPTQDFSTQTKNIVRALIS